MLSIQSLCVFFSWPQHLWHGKYWIFGCLLGPTNKKKHFTTKPYCWWMDLSIHLNIIYPFIHPSTVHLHIWLSIHLNINCINIYISTNVDHPRKSMQKSECLFLPGITETTPELESCWPEDVTIATACCSSTVCSVHYQVKHQHKCCHYVSHISIFLIYSHVQVRILDIWQFAKGALKNSFGYATQVPQNYL